MLKKKENRNLYITMHILFSENILSWYILTHPSLLSTVFVFCCQEFKRSKPWLLSGCEDQPSAFENGIDLCSDCPVVRYEVEENRY